MKKLLVFFLLVASIAQGQDTVTIKHIRYSSTFDRDLHYPVLVHWVVKKKDVGCPNPIKRTDDFKPDDALQSATDLAALYKKIAANYDRGHNMNADDNKCNIASMHESFYFSNMTPQTIQLNRGPWKSLELQTRKFAQKFGAIEIWCGSFGKADSIGVLKIPSYCWKIIKYNGTTTAYIFPNTSAVKGHPYKEFVSTVTAIRDSTHLALPTL